MKSEHKDFEEFPARVKTTLECVPVDVMDRTIRSMDLIAKRKGKRIRY